MTLTFISPDGKKFALNSPKAVEVFQKLSDLINKYHVAPSPVQAKNIPATNIALQTKKVAMVVDGQWSLMSFAHGTKFNYNVGVLPKIGNKPMTTVVDGMFTIFKSTKHPKEAWELLKALIDPSATFELDAQGLWMPALISWYQKPDLLAKWEKNQAHPSGYKNAVIDMLLHHSHQTPTGYVKNFNKIMNVVNPELDKLWLGQETAKQAMDHIAPKAQSLVQGRRPNK